MGPRRYPGASALPDVLRVEGSEPPEGSCRYEDARRYTAAFHRPRLPPHGRGRHTPRRRSGGAHRGDIVEMSPIGGRHAMCVIRLTRSLVREVGDVAIVSVRNPVKLDERTEPQPDLTLIRDRDYRESLPMPEDVLLLIEVSDTTLAYDRGV